MGRLQAWWRRLTGGQGATTAAPPAPQAPAPKAPALRTPPPPPPDGLELAGEPEHKRPARVGAAGFDPYSSDAGYAKPHSWERIDHD